MQEAVVVLLKGNFVLGIRVVVRYCQSQLFSVDVLINPGVFWNFKCDLVLALGCLNVFQLLAYLLYGSVSSNYLNMKLPDMFK